MKPYAANDAAGSAAALTGVATARAAIGEREQATLTQANAVAAGNEQMNREANRGIRASFDEAERRVAANYRARTGKEMP